MKKLIFIITISFFTQEVWCQTPGGCGISYEYNAMGQRVKRSKLCNGGGSNLRPSNNSSNEIENQTRLLEIKVFPNPTNEQITVNFSTSVAARIDLGTFQTDNKRTTGGRILQLASRFTVENGQQFFGKMYAHARNVTGNVDNVDYYAGATLVNRNEANGGWGLTLGSYINSLNMDASSMDEMFVHEYGHTIQSRLTGPLYLPMVGVPSLIGSILDIGIGTDLGHNGAIGLLLRNGGLHNHNDEWNEIQANRLSYSYFGNFRKNDYDKMQWENEEYKREYVYDWYFRLTNPHAFMWWLEF